MHSRFALQKIPIYNDKKFGLRQIQDSGTALGTIDFLLSYSRISLRRAYSFVTSVGDRRTAHSGEGLLLEECTDRIGRLALSGVGKGKPPKFTYGDFQWLMNMHNCMVITDVGPAASVNSVSDRWYRNAISVDNFR